jgi:hypothetical protein
METAKPKHCPICNRDLPVSEFGICQSRKDGRNLYCKEDIRQKVAAQRKALKEYKALRKKHRPQIEADIYLEESQFEVERSLPALVKLSPVERVRLAIKRGLRTQSAIGQETKLGKDEISDALAVLILHRREVTTQSDGQNRYYYVKTADTVEPPKRKDCVLSLSCLGPVIKHERVA